MVAVEAFPARFLSISSYTDSMCSIGALSKTSTAMKPYFGNRVSEIQHLRAQLAEYTDDLAPVHHIPGSCNPADVGTRSGVLVEDLSEGSLWQCGPSFLSQPYSNWPITSDEARFTARVPTEEVRTGQRETASQGVTLSTVCGPVPGLIRAFYDGVGKGDLLGTSVGAMAREVLTREKLEVSVRILARVLRAVVGGDRSMCARSPPVRYVELAVQLLLRIVVHFGKRSVGEGTSGKPRGSTTRRNSLGAGTCSGRGARPPAGDL